MERGDRAEQGRRGRAARAATPRRRSDSQPYFWTEQFGLSLKAVGHLPLVGTPILVDGASPGRRAASLLRWDERRIGGAAVAVNYRIPIPRLRRLCDAA